MIMGLRALGASIERIGYSQRGSTLTMRELFDLSPSVNSDRLQPKRLLGVRAS